MTANRSSLLTKVHKVLNKHYKPVMPNLRRSLMHQLIYAGCLEDATAELADQAFAALETQYYDWNEVRVSTATELSESMHMLPDAKTAAVRVKRVLQSVFEDVYSFDIEYLKKENIGVAVKKLNKLKGVTPFVASYVTQTGLSGHSIPVSNGSLDVLFIVGAISEKEKAAASVPGLERAIPKNKGVEFGSLLNQLGVEFVRAPHGPAARKILLEIAPDAKDRLPKRQSKKEKESAKAAHKTAKQKKVTAGKSRAGKSSTVKKKSATNGRTPAKKTVTVKRKKKTSQKKAAAKPKKKVLKKKVAKKTTSRKKGTAKRVTKRKPR